MANLTIPITADQILDLARQLSPEERRLLLDNLLAERVDAAMAKSDRRQGPSPEMTDEEIQAEVDAVRQKRREDRLRASGH